MTFDWSDLVPAHIAQHQKAWERHRRFARMRDLGFKFKEIAAREGVSTERAKDLVAKGRRPSPVQTYLGKRELDFLFDTLKLGLARSSRALNPQA